MNTKFKNEVERFNALNAELKAAFDNMVAVSTQLSSARDFRGRQKGYLNEHQFPALLEAASSDSKRARELIAAQTRRRAAYAIGQKAVNNLMGHLGEERDRFARALMKVVATVPAFDDVNLANALAASCLRAAQDAAAFSTRALDDITRDQDSDPTQGSAERSLHTLYLELIGAYAATEGTDKPVLEPDRVIALDFQLASRHHKLAKTNDKLAAAIRQCAGLVEASVPAQGQNLDTAWKNYRLARANLNEPQYSELLEKALSIPNNEAQVEHIKACQNQKRGNLAKLRQEISTELENVQPAVTCMIDLLRQLAAGSEMETVERHLRSVLVTNMLMADFLVHKAQEFTQRWQQELSASNEQALATRKALGQALFSLTQEMAYRGRQWYYDKLHDSYVEPL